MEGCCLRRLGLPAAANSSAVSAALSEACTKNKRKMNLYPENEPEFSLLGISKRPETDMTLGRARVLLHGQDHAGSALK